MKENTGWIVTAVIAIIVIFSVYVSGSKSKKEEEVELMSGKHNVVITVKNYGDIKFHGVCHR